MIELTHIGEALLAEMFNRSPAVKRLIADKTKIDRLLTDGSFAVPEVPLSTCGDFRFDGAHRIDVALASRGDPDCLAIESKLGESRMGAKTFDSRFLKQCGTSHGGTRITGSMVSILDGNLPNESAGKDIKAAYEDLEFRLRKRWVLVVRQSVLNSWLNSAIPRLSERCVIISFEEIAGMFGGGDQFNNLVKEIIEADYYQLWLGDLDE